MPPMSRRYFPHQRLRTTHYALFILSTLILSSCTPPTPLPLSSNSSLFAFDLSTFSLIEFDSNFNVAREIPVDLPCPLLSAHPAPTGKFLALELDCMNGPLVLVVDVTSGTASVPYPAADSHFLAWDFDQGLYLRVDALGNTRIMRLTPNGPAGQFPIPAAAYDMDIAPNDQTILYSFTRGLGLGSELWAATSTANKTWQVRADANSIITFARWSPDGRQIAFIALPDSATPFPLGQLWLMNADGSDARPLAPADSGHGYAPAWSPDSKYIAFVHRENPDDPRADQAADALVSNIYIVEAATGEVNALTQFEGALVEAPVWSADGHYLAFAVVHALDDTITVWIADATSGEITKLASPGPLCCPAWMRK